MKTGYLVFAIVETILTIILVLGDCHPLTYKIVACGAMATMVAVNMISYMEK